MEGEFHGSHTLEMWAESQQTEPGFKSCPCGKSKPYFLGGFGSRSTRTWWKVGANQHVPTATGFPSMTRCCKVYSGEAQVVSGQEPELFRSLGMQRGPGRAGGPSPKLANRMGQVQGRGWQQLVQAVACAPSPELHPK